MHTKRFVMAVAGAAMMASAAGASFAAGNRSGASMTTPSSGLLPSHVQVNPEPSHYCDYRVGTSVVIINYAHNKIARGSCLGTVQVSPIN